MSDRTFRFRAGVTFPDGREVFVSYEAPEEHPSMTGRDLLEATEYVQIAATTVARNALRADENRARIESEGPVPF